MCGSNDMAVDFIGGGPAGWNASITRPARHDAGQLGLDG